MLYTDARSQKDQRARADARRTTFHRPFVDERTLDEPHALLARLARERRRDLPLVVIPHHVQWRTVEYATQRWAASTILERPEFGPKVKFAVRDRASLEARIAWLTTDPPITDGNYLLETLHIAQHPRGGSAPIHLLGNRPSLVLGVFEYQLEPLYPAAARHTASLDEHVHLVEALERIHEGPVRNWAADVFDARTDVSWIFRQRIRTSIRRAVGPPRPDIGSVTAAWDAIRFVEAGAPSGALSTLPNDVCRIRRAAVQILEAEAGLPGPVVAAAVSTANRIVATTLCQVVAAGATDVTPPPTELLTAIIEQPPGPMLAGEMSPAPKKAPSVRPTSTVAGRSTDGIATSPAYRASPDGSVVAVGV